EIRSRNFLQKGDRLPTGEALETEAALPHIPARAVEALGERSRPSAPSGRVGRGIACNMQPYGRTVWFRDRAQAWIGFEADGALVIRAGVTDLGGGQAASLAQLAAEVLGVSPDRIAVHIGDSALTPLAGGTFATRQLYMSGNAVVKAAGELRAMMIPVAASLLEAAEPDVQFAGNHAGVIGAPERTIALARVVKECARRGIPTSLLSGFQGEHAAPIDLETGQGRTFPDYTFGCHAVEVESGEGKGPFSARGIGEPPTGPPPAAVAAAIQDAVGVRLMELPMTSERVFDAVRARPARPEHEARGKV